MPKVSFLSLSNFFLSNGETKALVTAMCRVIFLDANREEFPDNIKKFFIVASQILNPNSMPSSLPMAQTSSKAQTSGDLNISNPTPVETAPKAVETSATPVEAATSNKKNEINTGTLPEPISSNTTSSKPIALSELETGLNNCNLDELLSREFVFANGNEAFQFLQCFNKYKPQNNGHTYSIWEVYKELFFKFYDTYMKQKTKNKAFSFDNTEHESIKNARRTLKEWIAKR